MNSTRRTFLETSIAAGMAAGIAAPLAFAVEPKAKLPVAGITTTYGPNNHADVIFTKIVSGYEHDGGPGPDLKLTSLFVEQEHPRDLSRGLSEKHGFRLARSIDEALTLGSDDLAVSGVLIVGEHGNYPNDPVTGQKMYPRRRLFDEVVKTFKRVGKVVPVFNDKHLSYNWPDAEHMAKTAREMKFPFMAGSSLPVAWRLPPLVLERECQIEEALAIGYSSLESYGFHAVEVLQCMVERRRGGETGVRRIEVVKRDAIWAAQKAGRWSRELFDAALATTPEEKKGEPEKLLDSRAAFYLIEYRDGLRATVAMANGVTRNSSFAAKLKGQPKPVATWFAVQNEAPFGHFGYLLKAIEQMVRTGRPAYPVERTLLTTGIINAAMKSYATSQPIETPYLDIAYQPADWPSAPGKPS
ncbi:hypothetical protein ETAA8_15340 [Anatilimnocola aggregata]|uniref:Uncharacterized protein n=1 Tax=Anatilimnocola aggregata TaxID=2528021 RepID=A0A517Y8A6_9BACT|nr:hypothetical protein [Anatilimnocola aggregata]QDU26456.1 hypothetical protein ETAA8_15340 [Anatilimnocola aggregata]